MLKEPASPENAGDVQMITESFTNSATAVVRLNRQRRYDKLAARAEKWLPVSSTEEPPATGPLLGRAAKMVAAA